MALKRTTPKIERQIVNRARALWPLELFKLDIGPAYFVLTRQGNGKRYRVNTRGETPIFDEMRDDQPQMFGSHDATAAQSEPPPLVLTPPPSQKTDFQPSLFPTLNPKG